MKTMKNEIELRLIGSLLSDWCKQRAEKDESFIYRSGFDSTHRVIRFTTPVLQSLFALPENQKGHWTNGFAAMYEIHNAPEGVTLSCTCLLYTSRRYHHDGSSEGEPLLRYGRYRYLRNQHRIYQAADQRPA